MKEKRIRSGRGTCAKDRARLKLAMPASELGSARRKEFFRLPPAAEVD
jgi:hypothetical protein